MKKTNSPDFILSRYNGVLSNPVRIHILKEMAAKEQPLTELLVIEGFTSFTVKQNLKYLKKHGLVTGDLTVRHLSYSLDLYQLAEFKKLMDELFSYVIKQPQINLKFRSKAKGNH